ncbi:MAG TPA: hypothetical protein VN451_07065, partial [Chitinophagaceae bacterium]|nr:hypothetical protein [Chitinophagaceae bacterium]
MKKLFTFSILVCSFSICCMAQLKIDNATFFIGSGATVTVQGDVTSNVDIEGTGLLQLKGSSLQNVDMGGNTIPNLELDNTSNATLLNTNTRIGTSLTFTNGKFQTGNLNLLLSTSATITGGSSSRFVWTNGTGQLIKQLSADVASFELPVGENSNYRPAYLTTSGSSYSSAQFGVRVLGAADANKPPMIASYLNTNWPVTRSGITGGTVSLLGQYIDPTDITGTEANLVGYYNSGTDWSSSGESHNATTNRVGAPVTAASGVISGMNKFLAVGSRAILQGAYVAGTGLMSDNLRTLTFGSSASTANFPSTDPYRVSPYSSSFTHTNNTAVETISSAAILDQAGTNDDIVDWVFLELRNLDASPGNDILHTRAALIQRDGDIVDVDGVSPVTFNAIADGNYILAVRHRNHLGLSIDQSSPRALNETKSTAFTTNVVDLRIATDPQLYGTSAAYTTAFHPTLTTVNVLWGGNVNTNIESKYQGPGNDRSAMLTDLGGNELLTLT